MKLRRDKFRKAILDRVQRRFRRSRPGSVLILVVALLVLLALLGTAYINTAQTDRYSSAQNTFNTEIDLLLQGVEDMTKTAAVDAVFSSSTSSPTVMAFHLDTSTTQPSTPYAITDYPNNKPSTFIGDRYPSLVNPAASASTTNFPYWNYISALPSNLTFESPYANTTANPPTPPGSGNTYTNRTQMIPTYVQWQVTDTSGTHTVTYPALQFQITNPGPPPTPITYVALAGDADGDGIADCALFRLPIGQLNGVTYYGGVRVVDNCAAVNAAIAWQPNSLTASPLPLLPGNFFPTNIDLNDLLVSGDQANLSLLNQNARFGNQPSPSLTPVDDTGTARNDFTFGSQYEAFWMQLGRRLANPGYNTTAAQYMALPQSEMETMASRFILHDPSITSTNYTTSSSSLEKYLYNSCVLNSPSTPYTPDKALTWAQANFDFANTSATVPLRSMLVTQNGVSNFTYSKLHNPGTTGTTVATTPAVWSATNTYNFGDWVTYTDTNSVTRSYVCMQQNSANAPQTGVSTLYWEPQPWTTGPTRASANTATFGQLWAAYYSAMTETPITSTSLGGVSSAAYNAMFRSSWRTVNATTLAWNPTLTAVTNTNYSTAGLGFPQMQLRAAIAAINTLQLRNPNSASPTAPPLQATIKLTNASGTPAFTATVYGSAPQPYITEVYASTIGGTPYAAVELYNPYQFAISLATWQLAYFQRTNGATSLPALTAIAWQGTAPTVPANGFVLLVSSNTPPSYITTQPAGTPTLVPNLASALNNELVLLRPAAMANAGAFFGASFTATVPVDSYDFTGLAPSADPTRQADWHYIRPNASAANGVTTSYKNWHFVYPGPYKQIAGDFLNPREAGTMASPTPGTPQTTTLASLGAPDAAAVIAPPTYLDRPLQINNTGFAGANKTTASGNTFPYGGFGRNADLLQVTYVGAYQVTDATGATLYELNALPADSAMADDPLLRSDINATSSEQLGRQNIGRFTPVNWADTIYTSTPANPPAPPVYSQVYTSELAAYQAGHPAVTPPPAVYVPDDYWTQDTSLQTGYHWTLRLFDYITTQSPQDDYLPDVDPATSPQVYLGPAPQPVANVNKTIANASITNVPASATEETVPVHGRININTANWRVLATLPLFDNPYNAGAAADLARAIVYYRDVDDGTSTTAGQLHPHGAFQSIEELNNVVVTSASSPTTLSAGTSFRTAFGGYLGTFVVPGLHGSNVDGDLSPYTSGTPSTAGQDYVYGDFENQNLALNRISNLITTRSDSFTAYVLVQGWRNVGTSSPTLVVQRRGAFILDRSTITPLNNTQPAIVNIPTQ